MYYGSTYSRNRNNRQRDHEGFLQEVTVEQGKQEMEQHVQGHRTVYVGARSSPEVQEGEVQVKLC